MLAAAQRVCLVHGGGGGGGTVWCGYNGYPVTVLFLADGYPVTKCPTPSTRSNNLPILPDLRSNRISIHSPIISSDIHGRLQEILFLTVYHLKIYYFSCAIAQS